MDDLIIDVDKARSDYDQCEDDSELKKDIFDLVVNRLERLQKKYTTQEEELGRVCNDYSTILEHATCGAASRCTYDVNQMMSVIDEAQSKLHYSMVKMDLLDFIEGGEDARDIILYIKEYIKRL
jgi:hypothetical protein